MKYWSKGLGRRSSLHLRWAKGTVQITVGQGKALLDAVVPSHLTSVKIPVAEQVIIAGETLQPFAWHYISVLQKEDFEDIFKLAMSQEVVQFLAHRRGGWRLFLKLGGRLVGFFLLYVWTWAVLKAKRIMTSTWPRAAFKIHR